MANVVIHVGEKIQLDASVLYSDNVKRPATGVLTWSSNHNEFAMIADASPTGANVTVLGTGIGTATLTVTDVGDTLSLTYTVQVLAAVAAPTAAALVITPGKVYAKGSTNVDLAVASCTQTPN